MHRRSNFGDGQIEIAPLGDFFIEIGEVDEISLVLDQLCFVINLFPSFNLDPLNLNLRIENSKCSDWIRCYPWAASLALILEPILCQFKSSETFSDPASVILSKCITLLVVAFSFQVESMGDRHVFSVRIIATQSYLLFVLEVGEVDVGFIGKPTSFINGFFCLFFRVEFCFRVVDDI